MLFLIFCIVIQEWLFPQQAKKWCLWNTMSIHKNRIHKIELLLNYENVGMIWTLSHPMYLLLDHLCNKYFISNFYKSLFMISRTENIVTHISTSLSKWWIGCPILLNKLRITYSSQKKTYTCVYIEKSLTDWIYAFLLFATDIYISAWR